MYEIIGSLQHKTGAPKAYRPLRFIASNSCRAFTGSYQYLFLLFTLKWRIYLQPFV